MHRKTPFLLNNPFLLKIQPIPSEKVRLDTHIEVIAISLLFIPLISFLIVHLYCLLLLWRYHLYILHISICNPTEMKLNNLIKPIKVNHPTWTYCYRLKRTGVLGVCEMKKRFPVNLTNFFSG